MMIIYKYKIRTGETFEMQSKLIPRLLNEDVALQLVKELNEDINNYYYWPVRVYDG